MAHKAGLTNPTGKAAPAPVPISTSLVGLNPLTTYHFRAAASTAVRHKLWQQTLTFATLPNNNANLSGLVFSAGPLTPAFDPGHHQLRRQPHEHLHRYRHSRHADTNASPGQHQRHHLSLVPPAIASSPFALAVGMTTLQVPGAQPRTA